VRLVRSACRRGLKVVHPIERKKKGGGGGGDTHPTPPPHPRGCFFFFLFIQSLLACDLSRSWRDYVQSAAAHTWICIYLYCRTEASQLITRIPTRLGGNQSRREGVRVPRGDGKSRRLGPAARSETAGLRYSPNMVGGTEGDVSRSS